MAFPLVGQCRSGHWVVTFFNDSIEIRLWKDSESIDVCQWDCPPMLIPVSAIAVVRHENSWGMWPVFGVGAERIELSTPCLKARRGSAL
jgi:hypothetical protein